MSRYLGDRTSVTVRIVNETHKRLVEFSDLTGVSINTLLCRWVLERLDDETCKLTKAKRK